MPAAAGMICNIARRIECSGPSPRTALLRLQEGDNAVGAQTFTPPLSLLFRLAPTSFQIPSKLLNSTTLQVRQNLGCDCAFHSGREHQDLLPPDGWQTESQWQGGPPSRCNICFATAFFCFWLKFYYNLCMVHCPASMLDWNTLQQSLLPKHDNWNKQAFPHQGFGLRGLFRPTSAGGNDSRFFREMWMF